MLETAAQSRLSDAISPEVTCTTLWFMQRVTLTYLMPNENYYTEVSRPGGDVHHALVHAARHAHLPHAQ